MFGGIGKVIRKWFEGADGRGVPDILTEEEISRTVAAEDSAFPSLSRALDEVGKDLVEIKFSEKDFSENEFDPLEMVGIPPLSRAYDPFHPGPLCGCGSCQSAYWDE